MTADALLARIDVSNVYPPFLGMYKGVLEATLREGAAFYAVSGYRSFDEQTALYLQGRQTSGQIVTQARAGYSAHNFGVAIDGTRDADLTRPGLQPTWKIEEYEPLAQHAKARGLDAGYWWKFRDCPHVQLDLAAKHLTLNLLRIEYMRRRSLPDVWAMLDAHGPWA